MRAAKLVRDPVGEAALLEHLEQARLCAEIERDIENETEA